MSWWRGAVIYHIYLRSFADGNGDGIGDFAGLRSKLPYLSALGADALWLSPIHPSPDRDFGYDVADFQGVHPAYGGMDDFAAFLGAAHGAGLKVLLDEVLSHTADTHAWFAESLAARAGGKSDWYVWADAKPDGSPPNNWLSVFGGPAWSWHPVRRQYYFHKFLRQQPKLNWHCPAARAAALDVLRFWLVRGVDGFRLDVANSFLHDAALADNPPVPMAERTGWHWAHANNLQRHVHDANLPENRAALDDVRRTVEAFAERFVFGEFSEEPDLMGEFVGRDHGLHAGYTFEFLEGGPPDSARLRRFYARHAEGGGWPCVTFSNHDVPRVASRWGAQAHDPRPARLALALLLSLRGTVLLYQGEELGLTQADLPRAALRDPVGDLYWPFHKGRDGCRTPMPWTAGARHLGFSDGEPWLPLAPEHAALAVDAQEGDPGSTLNCTRAWITARRAEPVLVSGEIAIHDMPAPAIAFTRAHEGAEVFCAFNPSADEITIQAAGGLMPLALGPGGGTITGGRLTLPAWSSFIARRTP